MEEVSGSDLVLMVELVELVEFPDQSELPVCVSLTEVMVSADATMSARPALMMCSSRSFSIGSMPLGTLSIRENMRRSSGGQRSTQD